MPHANAPDADPTCLPLGKVKKGKDGKMWITSKVKGSKYFEWQPKVATEEQGKKRKTTEPATKKPAEPAAKKKKAEKDATKPKVDSPKTKKKTTAEPKEKYVKISDRLQDADYLYQLVGKVMNKKNGSGAAKESTAKSSTAKESTAKSSTSKESTAKSSTSKASTAKASTKSAPSKKSDPVKEVPVEPATSKHFFFDDDGMIIPKPIVADKGAKAKAPKAKAPKAGGKAPVAPEVSKAVPKMNFDTEAKNDSEEESSSSEEEEEEPVKENRNEWDE